jgi:hypothetical protein
MVESNFHSLTAAAKHTGGRIRTTVGKEEDDGPRNFCFAANKILSDGLGGMGLSEGLQLGLSEGLQPHEKPKAEEGRKLRLSFSSASQQQNHAHDDRRHTV